MNLGISAGRQRRGVRSSQRRQVIEPGTPVDRPLREQALEASAREFRTQQVQIIRSKLFRNDKNDEIGRPSLRGGARNNEQ
jgi:hypothetical protein